MKCNLEKKFMKIIKNRNIILIIFIFYSISSLIFLIKEKRIFTYENKSVEYTLEQVFNERYKLNFYDIEFERVDKVGENDSYFAIFFLSARNERVSTLSIKNYYIIDKNKNEIYKTSEKDIIKKGIILEDVDMYDALSDMEYNGIYYEIDDKLIMRAYGRNYYALCFQNDSELKDYLFEISKEKGIENIYYIFCEYSYIMEVIRYGIINIDIVNKKVTVDIKKEEKYIEIFEKIASKSYPKLLKNYEKYIDDELEDEEVEEYEDKMDEIMGKYSLKEFEKFLDKVKLE